MTTLLSTVQAAREVTVSQTFKRVLRFPLQHKIRAVNTLKGTRRDERSVEMPMGGVQCAASGAGGQCEPERVDLVAYRVSMYLCTVHRGSR